MLLKLVMAAATPRPRTGETIDVLLQRAAGRVAARRALLLEARPGRRALDGPAEAMAALADPRPWDEWTPDEKDRWRTLAATAITAYHEAGQ
jgi:hypothetical protein